MVLLSSCCLDANLILRFILDDVPTQRKKVLKLLKENQNFYVNDLIVSEVIYNLQKMKFSRTEILNSLSGIFDQPNIHYESPFLPEVLEYYESHPALSFVDCYSAAWAEHTKNEPLLTFDKKLSKEHPSAKLLA